MSKRYLRRLIKEPRRGYTVFASMRDIAGRNRGHAADSEKLRRQNLRLSLVELDVTDDLSVRQAFKRVVRAAGKIDVLVNNAWNFLLGAD